MQPPHEQSQPALSSQRVLVRDGFRLRGTEMTRIETFTDAAFAFALTLLVISFDAIPTSYAELTAALAEVPAFLGSAAIMLLFWWGHLTWSRRFGLQDGPTLLYSFLLVITTLIYVYPLRYMMGMIFSGIGHVTGIDWLVTDMTFPAQHEVNGLCAIYGFGFLVMSLSLVLLNVHALRQAEALQLNTLERFDTIWEIRAWLIVGGVGALSVLLALALPHTFTSVPAWVYMLLPIIMPIFSHVVDRKRSALRAAIAVHSSAP